MEEELYAEQLKREEECANAGYKKFVKEQADREKRSDGSNTKFGISIRGHLVGPIAIEMEGTLNNIHSTIKDTSLARDAVIRLLQVDTVEGKAKPHKWIDIHSWAHIGLSLVLETALNPNPITHTSKDKFGGDKKLLEKMSLSQLQQTIGKTLNGQVHKAMIKHTFPEFYRKANKLSEKTVRDGCKASTSYWESRMKRAFREHAREKRELGDEGAANLLEGKGLWSYSECKHIGSWVFRCVNNASGLFDVRLERRGKKNSYEIYLSEEGLKIREELMEYQRKFQVLHLPMLIPPEPVTDESNGGWLDECLLVVPGDENSAIQLSPKHQEFINRQQNVPFQINPFIKQLMDILVERELPLGKFGYYTYEEHPSVSQLLGYGDITDKTEQDRLVRQHPDYKSVRKEVRDIKDRTRAKVIKGLLARKVVDMIERVESDERHYFPMMWDFRGRIYSRVSFISWQSSDCGRYSIRFADKTPIDDRTEFWMKIGMANACGNDKLCWGKRILWVDNHIEEIINVGRMFDGGDFSRAYDFLTQDFVEEPFCLAAIANEYTKVFVDKTQDYSQVFITVDCSCSGTSIFNSWRRYLNGARLTNVVGSDEPQDVYMEVWNEMKRRAKPNTFRPNQIKRLEDTGLIRKMMKCAYLPAQYSSSESEQERKLRYFNDSTLAPAKLNFTVEEMIVLYKLWHKALVEVTSMSTVIGWFQARAKELIDRGDKTIRFTNSVGSVMTQGYFLEGRRKVTTFHHGSTTLLTESHYNYYTEKVDKAKVKAGITANITHLTDASALCEALWDYEGLFATIHDAVGFPPSQKLDGGIDRLKDGFIKATSHNVWHQFCLDNHLAIDPQTPPPVVGDFDLELVRESNYLYS